MKIIVARCASPVDADTDAQCDGLIEGLRNAGHRTELLIVPAIGTGFEAVMAVASHRLMNLKNSCDAMICLDRVTCLLPHDRKFALLADKAIPSADALISPEDVYFLNLIEAGIEEAKILRLAVRNKSKGYNISPLLRELK